MGKTRLYAYRVEVLMSNEAPNVQMFPFGLNRKVNLKDYCENYEKSEQIGGVNEHISKARGWLLAISEAVLIRQRDEKVIEHYKAPMFRLM
jgi:hypothetical protein